MAYTTINKGSDYFNTVLNTGDNTSPKSIIGFNFQPDLVWTKTRTYGNNHTLFDSVRGAGSGKEISSNSSAEEGSATINTATYGYLSSFDSDGFTATSGSSGINYFNESGSTYVNWGWLAANGTASNTNGSITSTVSANTTSGFSIVTWSGTSANATIGHGLSSAPKMIIIKNRDDTYDWVVYNKNIGNTGFLRLNTTNAVDTGINMFQNTDPTSSFFYVSSHGAVNGSGNDYVAYCFADVKGYSKFGSYTGNGSTDGTFVYTGFKPAYVMAKRTDSTASWVVWDNKRDIDNGVYNVLQPNETAAEITASYYLDFLSNGFKWRVASGATNASGGTYIYMAFAENPFTTSTGIPATAR